MTFAEIGSAAALFDTIGPRAGKARPEADPSSVDAFAAELDSGATDGKRAGNGPERTALPDDALMAAESGAPDPAIISVMPAAQPSQTAARSRAVAEPGVGSSLAAEEALDAPEAGPDLRRDSPARAAVIPTVRNAGDERVGPPLGPDSANAPGAPGPGAVAKAAKAGVPYALGQMPRQFELAWVLPVAAEARAMPLPAEMAAVCAPVPAPAPFAHAMVPETRGYDASTPPEDGGHGSAVTAGPARSIRAHAHFMLSNAAPHDTRGAFPIDVAILPPDRRLPDSSLAESPSGRWAPDDTHAITPRPPSVLTNAATWPPSAGDFGAEDGTESAATDITAPSLPAEGPRDGLRSATTTAQSPPYWPGSGDIARQIVVALAPSHAGGTEIILSPAELGKVRLTLRAEDGRITMQIMAERPETADLMRRHIDTLVQEFRALGYQSVSLDFGQNHDRGRSSDSHDPHENATPAAASLNARTGQETFPAAATPGPPGTGGGAAQLDLRM